MIDIQEDVLAILDTINGSEVFSHQPPTLFKNSDSMILFYEVTNEPAFIGDISVELGAIIEYNIDIYSKTPNTRIIREEVNRVMTEYGFVRTDGGTEFREQDYYVRFLTYKILK